MKKEVKAKEMESVAGLLVKLEKIYGYGSALAELGIPAGKDIMKLANELHDEIKNNV